MNTKWIKLACIGLTFFTVACNNEEDPIASENLGIVEMFSPGADADQEVKDIYNEYIGGKYMIIDIIIIALIALGVFFGYKKGLVGILIGVASLILSIILAFVLQGPVSEYLYSTPVGTSIESKVTEFVNDTLSSENNENVDSEDNTKKENDFFSKVIQDATNSEDTVKEASKNITMFILKGITFIGIFILVRIICYILQMILNVVFDLPILHSVNKFGGMAINLVATLLKLWILLAAIQLISSVVAIDFITNLINQSYLTKLLYENNILLNILQTTIKL